MNRFLLSLVGVCSVLVAACPMESEIPIDNSPRLPAPPPALPAAAAAGEADGGVASGLAFNDDDFVESESNRDPFRSFQESFQIKAPLAPQRLVLMPDVGVEQMRLIAIVTGMNRPRAMLVDPSGVGHVAARGDFLGRAEVVRTGGRDSLPVTLNWRVDRIRSTEVVLAREDPSSPNMAPLTKVLPLYDEAKVAGSLKEAESQAATPDFQVGAKVSAKSD